MNSPIIVLSVPFSILSWICARRSTGIFGSMRKDDEPTSSGAVSFTWATCPITSARGRARMGEPESHLVRASNADSSAPRARSARLLDGSIQRASSRASGEISPTSTATLLAATPSVRGDSRPRHASRCSTTSSSAPAAAAFGAVMEVRALREPLHAGLDKSVQCMADRFRTGGLVP